MKHHRNLRLVVCILLVLSMAGCATMNLGIKPISEMTPLEKATTAMSVYNDRADAYKAKVALPDLSSAERAVLRAEYETLKQAWPVIDAYYNAVKGNGQPITTAIVEYINNFLVTYRY
jgi:uncharacterized protein YceK